MNKQAIDEYLGDIADILMIKSTSVDNIGILKGRAGIALFLFLYSRYTENQKSADLAETIIIKIFDEIQNNVYNVEELSELGIAIEFLARNGFIDANTDEVLEELDILIDNALMVRPKRSRINRYAKYMAWRFTVNESNSLGDIQCRIKSSLDVVLVSEDNSFGSYAEILSRLDFLSDIYMFWENPKQILSHINNAIRKLEDAVSDDIAFGCYPGTFNPLVAGLVILRVFKKTGLEIYKSKACLFIEKYGRHFDEYLDNDSSGLISGSFKWSVLYYYLAEVFVGESGNGLFHKWLNVCIEKKELFTDDYTEITPPGILDGYAGMGLSLLYVTGKISDTWIDIIPLYYERGKVTFKPNGNGKSM